MKTKINKDSEVKILEQLLSQAVKLRNELGEVFTPNDFDNWIGGYISSWSRFNQADIGMVKSIVDELIETELVKKVIGVTGTLKESITVFDIK